MPIKRLFVHDIVLDTTVDGPGFRTSIYCSGCDHRCKGCHNPQTWRKKSGKKMSVYEVFDIIKSSPNNVTFTGGDPLYQAEPFSIIAMLVKVNTGKNIWMYTGYKWSWIVRHLEDPFIRRLMKYVDVVVDGMFHINERDTNLMFRGSSNQRLIDVRRSLQTGTVVLYDYNPIPEL